MIDIPPSSTAHQASDFRYYKRHNFLSQPMEDYEIRDIMNRAKYPRLRLQFELHLYTPRDPMGMPRFFNQEKEKDAVSLELTVVNEGTVIARHVHVKLQIPTVLAGEWLAVQYLREGHEKLPPSLPVTLSNKKQDRSSMGNILSDIRYEPILPELSDELGSCTLNDKAWGPATQDLEISWRLHVDEAPATSGLVRLGDMIRHDLTK